MKEYGGYIELEYSQGTEYHSRAIALNSGRHCLEYLIAARHIQKLRLPLFLCNSVSDLCQKCGVEVEWYTINAQFLPQSETPCGPDEWLYVVNFYGQLTNATLEQLRQRVGHIIVDNAQAFFQLPLAGVDTLYTCRKFFGVADGGYLYTEATLDRPLEQDVSYDRMNFLLGRFEKTANEFYAEYTANNKQFATAPLKTMSRLTHNLLRGVNYESVKATRTANFRHLHHLLGAKNGLSLTVPEGAFMYPFYTENGAELRKILQQQKIYIPTLWPDVFGRCEATAREAQLAQNILPLPVDQRYNEDDMTHIAHCIDLASTTA